MEQPKVDYTSEGRFFMSFGIYFFFIAMAILFSALWIVKDINLNFYLNTALGLMYVFGVGGVVLLGVGMFLFIHDGAKDRKYKFEVHFNNILDQDLKLIELKTKELDYNRKVLEFNKDFKSNLETLKSRKIESFVRQAMDTHFYERNYTECLPKKYKGKRLF